jgi:hypothetical protein
MSACSSCGAQITWLLTGKGSAMPVDGDIPKTGPGNVLFDPKVHTSHFATCPNADKHRRSKSKTNV